MRRKAVGRGDLLYQIMQGVINSASLWNVENLSQEKLLKNKSVRSFLLTFATVCGFQEFFNCKFALELMCGAI
jgi:hypothetical protein